MKKHFLSLFVGLAVIATANPEPDANAKPENRFLVQESMLISEATIYPAGGVIAIDEPINVTITIPEGAVSEPTRIAVYRETGNLALIGADHSGWIIRIDAENLKSFDKLVTIDVQARQEFVEDKEVAAYSIDSKTGKFTEIHLTGFDREKEKAQFPIIEPTTVTWGWVSAKPKE